MAIYLSPCPGHPETGPQGPTKRDVPTPTRQPPPLLEGRSTLFQFSSRTAPLQLWLYDLKPPQILTSLTCRLFYSAGRLQCCA